VGDEEIALFQTHAALVNLEAEINDAKKKHNAFLKELGLPLLP
jgi:type I restriction enzyme M protein